MSESLKYTRHLPTFLEFFAGSGLVAEGLKGYFKAAWANDISERKAAVYYANQGKRHFVLGSIADIKGKDLPEAPLAWASFPCQDLSLAGLSKGIHGSRSGLVWEWLRVIDEMPIRPPVLVAENVSGLVSAAKGEHYRTLHNALTERGYNCGAILLDAARWIPQSRPRIFIIAVDAKITIPKTLIRDNPGWLQGDSIPKAAIGLKNYIWWNMPEPSSRKKQLKDIIEWDAPFASGEYESHNISLIAPHHAEVLKKIPESETPFVVPGYKRTRNGKQVLELRFDNTAGCLRTPGGGSSKQQLIFKYNNNLRIRLLTVREAARLMGAPDKYLLPGNYNDGYMAMGDAVAVPVVKWLAKYLLDPLVGKNG
jgi:DNA (cytosine-5)-methyltransferase 1